jgi:thymidylate synthase (FAD)
MIEATLIDHMGSDISVVNAARVSFGKKSELVCTDHTLGTYELKEGDKKLIKYLAKHNHISPFGHAFASFHVKAPIFVARQLVKHKFLRWNEISRRYVADDPVFYEPDVWRYRAEDVKQGSSSEGTTLSEMYGWDTYKKDMYSVPLQHYKSLLKKGVCPEQARMVLPKSMMTEWYWSGSLDAFADMCKLRCKPDTQLESRMVADPISNIMSNLFPVSWEALVGQTTP